MDKPQEFPAQIGLRSGESIAYDTKDKTGQQYMCVRVATYGALVNEFSTLLASRQRDRAIQEAVIILPDDVEPEVGDIIIVIKGQLLYHVISDETWLNVLAEFGSPTEALPHGGAAVQPYRIIQRNGRPVIYESAITAAAARLGEGV